MATHVTWRRLSGPVMEVTLTPVIREAVKVKQTFQVMFMESSPVSAERFRRAKSSGKNSCRSKSHSLQEFAEALEEDFQVHQQVWRVLTPTGDT